MPELDEAGMTILERLAAIEDIKLLKARRDRANDTKDWATYAALHAPDHVSHNDGYPEWRGPEEVTANTARAQEGMTTAHHSHTPEITFRSPTKADGIWALDDWGYWKEDGRDCWAHVLGYYFETYEKRGGRWLFTSRRLKVHHQTSSSGQPLIKIDGR
jgi:hypothetical protein